MGVVNQYEVYYKISDNNYPDRDDVPSKGKLMIKKARDESDAKDKAIDIITDGLNIKSRDLQITEVLFWDHLYD